MSRQPGPGQRAIEVGQWPAHLAQVRQCKEMSMSEWISVEDRLPEISPGDGMSEYVLIVGPLLRHLPDEPTVSIGYLVEETGLWRDRANQIYPSVVVTHWMPLPEPPQTAVTEAQP